MLASPFTNAFASLAYTAVIIEKKVSVKGKEGLAAALRIADRTMYDYLEAIATFPPDRVKPFLAKIDDARLRDFFTQPGYIQVKKPPERKAGSNDIYGEFIDVDVKITELKQYFKKASENGLNSIEKNRLNSLIDNMLKEAEELRNVINTA